jgi:chitodextrinase
MLRPALAGIAVLAALALLPAAASAALTKPTLRVTATTTTTVSVAWTTSRDAVRYEVNLWQGGAPVSVPKTQTSFTLTGLRPNVQYYVWVVAVDARGNKAFSNQLTVVTDADRIAPSTPGNLRVTGVTASKVSLAWDASSDNTGILAYHVQTSAGALSWTGPTSVDVVGLPPSTAFSFAVRAQDLGYNHSPFTAPVSATTLGSTDVTPPSAPRDLVVSDNWCGEVGLQWAQSSDDQDPQSAIRYRIFINGTVDPLGDARGVGRWITYGVDGANTFVLRAIDSAGNVSAPSNAFTLDLDLC